jgi:Asp-tRNA(Asn)/Glu-tRNA(Gln) amidotransferase A subunit family amidase
LPRTRTRSGPFAALDIDAARQRADAPQLAELPLRGLPIGVKDIFDTADMPTAYGSPIYAATSRRRTQRWSC